MIPADLVPLAEIARQLRTDSKQLIAQSADGEFPPVYRVVGRNWRVSQSAVDAWFANQSADRIHADRKRTAALVRARLKTLFRREAAS